MISISFFFFVFVRFLVRSFVRSLAFLIMILMMIFYILQSLIETMKHAIVCLQIAKANSDPANGLHTSDELKAILTSFTEKYTSITSENSNSVTASSLLDPGRASNSAAGLIVTSSGAHRSKGSFLFLLSLTFSLFARSICSPPGIFQTLHHHHQQEQ